MLTNEDDTVNLAARFAQITEIEDTYIAEAAAEHTVKSTEEEDKDKDKHKDMKEDILGKTDRKYHFWLVHINKNTKLGKKFDPAQGVVWCRCKARFEAYTEGGKKMELSLLKLDSKTLDAHLHNCPHFTFST